MDVVVCSRLAAHACTGNDTMCRGREGTGADEVHCPSSVIIDDS